MQSALFLYVIISECSTIFELFAGKDKSLLIWRDAFFILNFLFYVIDGIGGFDFEGDGFTGESFNEDLHSWCGMSGKREAKSNGTRDREKTKYI